ncbi:peptidoglycan DD-metalloendopeptidase family protein [Rhizobium ruizarguesonis]|uniref:peptidoglycan DD-metalloendopeptidase family protein n=1 Tax=Rhizobium ruizarguesonis TaxID=2081791 RepID=UPI00102F9D95|nr:M23 family metallopeptidase [Rhizobium ruizarguesonis]TAY84517.1 hypothetical protein ELH85_32330 [Rhizobium ruizarguesonis]
MPQDTTFTYDNLEDAKFFQKMYDDVGAKTQVVEIDGGYALIVKFGGDWQPPADDQGPGAGEENPPDDTQTIGTGTGGKPSTPVQTKVPFASYDGDLSKLYWPVITSDPSTLVVSHKTAAGKLVGRDGRRFLADRSGGARYHVGIDIFCAEGDEVVACADGRIVNFYRFYRRPSTLEETYALFVKHGNLVINYGEVKAGSSQRYGWNVGSLVSAGQKIARVSGTAMIHFETYEGSATVNARWMQNEPNPPPQLRDPTDFLIKVSVSGKRLVPAGTPNATATTQFTGPLPSGGDWHNKFNGRSWRYDQRGVYSQDLHPDQPWRTDGEPNTCRDIFQRFGPAILEAARKHKVNPAIIIMTIATESALAREEGFTGPKTYRWEAHPKNVDVDPPFNGTYSAGPMQCLATSVRELIVKKGQTFGLAYDPFTVAPATKTKPSTPPASHPLYDPTTSIDIGAAEIRWRWSQTGDDPILVAAAYNAGGIYETTHSAWGIRAYDDHLDRAAKWYGDACVVLSEAGIL